MAASSRYDPGLAGGLQNLSRQPVHSSSTLPFSGICRSTISSQIPDQGMRQGQPPADRASKPEPKTKKGVPSQRSRLGSKGTSLSLKGGMHKVMESGEYSDLTVLCDDRKYLVHKVVVCSQSNVLAAAMKKGFKECELNTIDLSDNGALPVSYLISFLYTGNYYIIPTPRADSPPLVDSWEYGASSSSSSSVTPTRQEVTPKVANQKQIPDYSLHVEMYALSDEYDIPALGILAKAKFDVTCSHNWHSMSFLEIVPRVYESTLESNQGLRKLVIEHARTLSKDFMEDELLEASFQSLLAEIPEFCTELLNRYMTVSQHFVDGASAEATGIREDIWRLDVDISSDEESEHDDFGAELSLMQRDRVSVFESTASK